MIDFTLSGPRPPEEPQEKLLLPMEGPGVGPMTDNGLSPSILKLIVAQRPEMVQMAQTPPPVKPSKFRTSLVPGAGKEEEMIQRALRRIVELKREMGLDAAGAVVPGSWMGIRKRNSDSFEGDYTWRTAIGGIFTKSNFSLGTNTRHVRYLAARVQDDLLGTTPFFAALGKNPDKSDLAKQAEKFVQDEIDRCEIGDALRDGQKTALIINEAVMKTTYQRTASLYRGPAKVEVDQMGNPIKTPIKQLYVFEDDNFLPHPSVEGMEILEKDASYSRRIGAAQIREFPDLDQELVQFEGVKTEPVDFRCFLCPLRVKDIHEADINVHLYQEEPDNLRGIYDGVDVSDRYFNWWDFTGDQVPKTIQGEGEEITSAIVRKVTIAECYLRFDADGDGRAEEIFLVLDMENQKAIFFDYLANHFSKRPFEVIPGLERVRGRWYGRGVFSIGEDHELHMDAEFNRAQVKGSRASSVTFRQKAAVTEWNNNMPVVFGTDDIYDLNPGYDADKNPPIFKMNLAESNDQALELMEISRQASDSVIGAISVKDASQSDMNQSKTATGIMNLQQASDTITKATEQEHAKPINRILGQVVYLALDHMDKLKLMFAPETNELVTLNREEIRSLRKDVKLLLTRSRSNQLLSTNERALAIAKDYRMLYLQDPEGAKILRPAYIAQLKALEVNEADEICPEVTEEYLAQFQAAQAAQAQAQQAQAQAEQGRAEQEHAAKINKLNQQNAQTPAVAA